MPQHVTFKMVQQANPHVNACEIYVGPRNIGAIFPAYDRRPHVVIETKPTYDATGKYQGCEVAGFNIMPDRLVPTLESLANFYA